MPKVLCGADFFTLKEATQKQETIVTLSIGTFKRAPEVRFNSCAGCAFAGFSYNDTEKLPACYCNGNIWKLENTLKSAKTNLSVNFPEFRC